MVEQNINQLDRICGDAADYALQKLSDLNFPVELRYEKSNFDYLGTKTSLIAKSVLTRLERRWGDRLPSLLALALHEVYFVTYFENKYVSIMIENPRCDEGADDDWQQIVVYQGMRAMNISLSLYVGLEEHENLPQRIKLREKISFDMRLRSDDLLLAAALHWFAMAAQARKDRANIEVFDALAEAQQALTYAYGESVWEQCEKIEQEKARENEPAIIAAAISDIQRKRAHASHAEDYAMKEDAFKWLDKNPLKPRGKEAAAREIIKQVNIKSRTARKWVDQWQAEHSAGKR